jgi:hypothetical protein
VKLKPSQDPDATPVAPAGGDTQLEERPTQEAQPSADPGATAASIVDPQDGEPVLLPETQALWDAFMASPLAEAIDWATQRAAVEEWIWHEDEAARGRQTLRKYRLTKGTSGQPVVSPLAAYVSGHEEKAQRLREQFGMAGLVGGDPLEQVEEALLRAARAGNVTAQVFWLEHRGGSTWKKPTPAEMARELGSATKKK